jgi:hypothetical protein
MRSMVNFFRKGRQNLLRITEAGKPGLPLGRYLKYAIGEIFLVVIGILIALSINNFNENRKLIKVEIQLLENLITSLKKDSVEIARILPFQIKSVDQHNIFINSSAQEILNSYSEIQISQMLFELWRGGYSFYPKYGAYNSIVSSKGIDILESESIKSRLIDLYDYRYKRYESIDLVLDNRFQNILIPFLIGKIGFYVNSKFEYNTIDKNRFENKFEELQLECMNLTGQLNPSLLLLQSIQGDINLLLKQLEEEIKNVRKG